MKKYFSLNGIKSIFNIWILALLAIAYFLASYPSSNFWGSITLASHHVYYEFLQLPLIFQISIIFLIFYSFINNKLTELYQDIKRIKESIADVEETDVYEMKDFKLASTRDVIAHQLNRLNDIVSYIEAYQKDPKYFSRPKEFIYLETLYRMYPHNCIFDHYLLPNDEYGDIIVDLDDMDLHGRESIDDVDMDTLRRRHSFKKFIIKKGDTFGVYIYEKSISIDNDYYYPKKNKAKVLKINSASIVLEIDTCSHYDDYRYRDSREPGSDYERTTNFITREIEVNNPWVFLQEEKRRE